MKIIDFILIYMYDIKVQFNIIVYFYLRRKYSMDEV